MINQEPRLVRGFRITLVFEYRFNEMRFLTVDALLRVSVFIAKLTKR